MTLTARKVASIFRFLGLIALVAAVGAQHVATAAPNLLVNRGFEDTFPVPGDGVFGDGWGRTGAAAYRADFGNGVDNEGHLTFFGDRDENEGFSFQQGILATPGAEYQFDLLDTLIESSFSPEVLRFGLEFYDSSDTNKLGENIVDINFAERLANAGGGNSNGNVFSVRGLAPAGATFVRPVINFDVVSAVVPNSPSGAPNSNFHVFDAYLSEIPAPGGNLLKNPQFDIELGDADQNAGRGNLNKAIVWNTFGNAQINNFFGSAGSNNPPHGSLFGDDPAQQSGGLFQPSILTEAGQTLRFTLENVLIESNYNANLFFGIQFHGSDDSDGSSFFPGSGPDVIPDTIVAITPSPGENQSFTVDATAPAGAVYARPIVFFNNVPLSNFQGDPNHSVFIFDTSLIEVVEVSLPGDFNSDEQVSAADYTVWRDSLGTSNPLGGNGDETGASGGIVDQADYALWASNFGQGAPGLGVVAVAAVPEPRAWLLLMTTLVVLMLRRGHDMANNWSAR
jgi:hypothetical protein